jgi:arginase
MRIQILAVPYDTARRGWRMGAGPEHLLSNGLRARLEAAGHTVAAAILEPRGDKPAEIATAFDLMARVAEAVRAALADGAFPLVLSGNCNSAVGTLSGLTPRERTIFWFDAHGDSNTPDTTTTGFLDGTSLAAAMGWGWRGMTKQVPGFQPVDPKNVMLLGARDLDPDEQTLLDDADVRRLSTPEIAERRLASAIATLPDGAAYVHCDLDVLDPSEGQANPFPTPGGVSVAELEEAIATIGRARPIAAAAVTAYAPEYDADGRVLEAAMRVALAIAAAARV